MSSSDLVLCPFCKEDGFDLPGLKFHLGGCEAYDDTEVVGSIWDRLAEAKAAKEIAPNMDPP